MDEKYEDFLHDFPDLYKDFIAEIDKTKEFEVFVKEEYSKYQWGLRRDCNE